MRLSMKLVLTALVAGPGDTHDLARRIACEARKLAPLMGRAKKKGLVISRGGLWHSRQIDAFEQVAP